MRVTAAQTVPSWTCCPVGWWVVMMYGIGFLSIRLAARTDAPTRDHPLLVSNERRIGLAAEPELAAAGGQHPRRETVTERQDARPLLGDAPTIGKVADRVETTGRVDGVAGAHDCGRMTRMLPR